jgi:hypothetical protein
MIGGTVAAKSRGQIPRWYNSGTSSTQPQPPGSPDAQSSPAFRIFKVPNFLPLQLQVKLSSLHRYAWLCDGFLAGQKHGKRMERVQRRSICFPQLS